MAGTKIILSRPAVCKDPCCGAHLPVGTEARYYGRHGIYGIHCHTKQQSIDYRHGVYRAEEQARILAAETTAADK